MNFDALPFLWRASLGGIGLILLYVFISLISYSLRGQFSPLMLTVLMSWFLMAAICTWMVLLSLKKPYSYIWRWPGGDSFLQALKLSSKLFFGVVLALLLLSLLEDFLIDTYFPHLKTTQEIVDYLYQLQDHPYVFLFFTVSIAFLGPLAEEILCRGFLQTGLHAFFSPWSSIILASLVFASLHWNASLGAGNAFLIFKLFSLSLILGWAYEVTGSLWSSFFLHSFFNLFNVMLIFLFNENFEKYNI